MAKIVVEDSILRTLETLADKRKLGRIRKIRQVLFDLRSGAVPVEEKTVFFQRFFK